MVPLAPSALMVQGISPLASLSAATGARRSRCRGRAWLRLPSGTSSSFSLLSARVSLQTCRASSQDQEVKRQSSGTSATSENSDKLDSKPSSNARTTVMNLNSILGIDEEAEREAKEAKDAEELGLNDLQPAAASASKGMNTRSKEERRENSLEGSVSEQMERLMKEAEKLRQEERKRGDKSDGQQDEQQLRKEFENLLVMLKPDGGVSKEDIKILKEQVFGPLTFWVTETRQTEEQDGFIIRGNLRAPKEQVFPEAIEKVKQLFGGKYELLIVEDPDATEPNDKGQKIRPAFKLVPASAAYPPGQTSWQVLVSLVLLTLTFGSCLQFGLVAEISKLPQETLQWLLNPDNLNQADAVPPGLEDFDAVGYVSSAFPIALITFGLQGIHEIGHRISALINGTKLGPSFLVPNGQLGTFGSVTQFKSMLRNNKELFDVAVSGPLAGGAASLAVFAIGLVLSAGAQQSGADAGDLIPIPAQMLQSSLGLGALTSAFLGEAASSGSQILVHPALISGWVGLYATALNLLPVGCMDGGRVVQAAFGKGTLMGSAFITYLGLALGFLGGELALPFGLYVLLVQRSTEQYIQDSVTEVGKGRRSLAMALVVLAFFVLLPYVPDAADSVGSVSPEYFL